MSNINNEMNEAIKNMRSELTALAMSACGKACILPKDSDESKKMHQVEHLLDQARRILFDLQR
jgi:hypothetical protein